MLSRHSVQIIPHVDGFFGVFVEEGERHVLLLHHTDRSPLLGFFGHPHAIQKFLGSSRHGAVVNKSDWER